MKLSSHFDPSNQNIHHVFNGIQNKQKTTTIKTENHPINCINDFKQKQMKKLDEPVKFSARELEIIQLILEEKTCQEIADELFLSLRTIESHRKRIIQKCGCTKMVGVIAYVLRNGILP